jgi:hypothetical protein
MRPIEGRVSARERLRNLEFAPEYLVARNNERQLVRLGIRLQGSEVSACIGKLFVLALALLQ